MNIKTFRVKQYNSTPKTVVMVDEIPVCIVAGCGKTVSNILAYLDGYDVPIADGKIRNILDQYRRNNHEKDN